MFNMFFFLTTRKDNIPWNSNIIVERISNSVLKTLTGRIYILVGKMSKHVNVGESVNISFIINIYINNLTFYSDFIEK